MLPKSNTQNEYLKRINIVIDYINNHLAETITIDELAFVSNFSKYHFHRIMGAYLGESIGNYIIRIRLEQAARLLKYSSDNIEQIAFEVGYNSVQCFSRRFKQYYGINPSNYRTNPNFQFMETHKTHEGLLLPSPKIVEIQPMQAIYIRVIGAYGNVAYSSVWKELIDYAISKNLMSDKTQFIGISYDDPKITPENKLRYDACMVIDRPISVEGKIGVKTIEGGRYAVFSYQGAYQQLGLAYDYICGKWLQSNDFILRNIPLFEKYLDDHSNTPAEQLRTEIYVPIQ